MSGPTEEVRAQLARASRRAALVSAFGAVVLLGSLVFSGLKLKALDGEVADLGDRKAVLQKDIAALKAEKESLEEERDSLEQQWEVASRYQAEQRALTAAVRGNRQLALSLVVEPKASAKPIGEDRYHFELWLDVPRERARELRKVDYYFNHPSFTGDKHRESSDARKGYRVSYDGWGALSRVIVTLQLANGKSEQITFNMHEYINNAGTRVPEKENPPVKPKVPVYDIRKKLERLPVK